MHSKPMDDNRYECTEENTLICRPPDLFPHERNLMTNIGSPGAIRKGVWELKKHNAYYNDFGRIVMTEKVEGLSCPTLCWTKISSEVILQGFLILLMS